MIAAQSAMVRNGILAGMKPESFNRLGPHLEPVSLKRRAILQDYNRRIEYVYFIEHGVVSLFVRTRRDGPVEAAMVARLGFVGVTVVLGMMRSPNRAVVQVAGVPIRWRSADMRYCLRMLVTSRLGRSPEILWPSTM